MWSIFLLFSIHIIWILSQDQGAVPQPTLVCRGLGCSEGLSAPVLTQQRLGQFGPVQTCFFNRCQISGTGFFATQSCFGGPCRQTFSSSTQSCFGGPCSQTFSSSSSFSSPTQVRAFPGAANSQNVNIQAEQVQFSGGDNIFGPGGTFAQIFGKKK